MALKKSTTTVVGSPAATIQNRITKMRNGLDNMKRGIDTSLGKSAAEIQTQATSMVAGFCRSFGLTGQAKQQCITANDDMRQKYVDNLTAQSNAEGIAAAKAKLDDHFDRGLQKYERKMKRRAGIQ